MYIIRIQVCFSKTNGNLQKQTELKLDEVASFMKSVDIMQISLTKLYVRITWTFEQREEKMETAYNQKK